MPKQDSSPRMHTLAVHAGEMHLQEGSTPAIPPLVPSVGFLYPAMQDTEDALGFDGSSAGRESNYIYARYGAPNAVDFEKAVATLEGAEHAISFSSGMAALHAALLATLPEPGAPVLAAAQIYGATRALLDWLHATGQCRVQYADFINLQAVREAAEAYRPAVIFCEVLTNPLARVVRADLAADIAREMGARLVIDNTFATPYLVRPLALGADLVVHSATKYLNGHGDVTGGVAAGSEALVMRAYGHRKLLGAVWGAFDAWLALRGLRTFALRMERACHNALALAAWLHGQPGIERVYYPGLPFDACHADASALFEGRGSGGVLAFDLRGVSKAGAYRFVEALRVIKPVTSVGDLYSLILHPATASHRALSAEQRAALGILDGTLRLSVGIEDVEDLKADIGQALATLQHV